MQYSDLEAPLSPSRPPAAPAAPDLLSLLLLGTNPRVIENINFDMVPDDTSTASNGPNNRDCANSDQRVDTIPFDDRYSCDCTASQSVGPNCDEQAASPANGQSSAFDDNLIIILGVVGGLVLLVAGLLYRNRRLESWKRRQPVKFDEIMEKIRAQGLVSARDGVGDTAASPPAEIPRGDIVLLDQLGKGNFGEVHKGILSTKTTSSEGRNVQVRFPSTMATSLLGRAPWVKIYRLRTVLL
jgi:hypothetical protein